MEQKTKKLLLVDDDMVIRSLYQKIFMMKGYRVDIAIDGQDATDKLEQMKELPMLIILDIMMPRMTGFDFLQYVRHNDKLKNIPVVMLTSLSDDEATRKAMKLGAVGYLLKTEHEPKDIVKKIEDFIAKYSVEN
jgi:CheY-like chemotaxis protein